MARLKSVESFKQEEVIEDEVEQLKAEMLSLQSEIYVAAPPPAAGDMTGLKADESYGVQLEALRSEISEMEMKLSKMEKVKIEFDEISVYAKELLSELLLIQDEDFDAMCRVGDARVRLVTITKRLMETEDQLEKKRLND